MKKTTKKKSQLERLMQTDGKNQKEQKYEPTTLAQIWGATGLNTYGTFNSEEYEVQLDTLSKSELYAHCEKHGIIPTGDRQRMKKNLIREFRRHVAQFKQPQADDLTATDISRDARRILAEGAN